MDSLADAQGFDGSRFSPVIAAGSAGTRATGVYRQASMSPTFVAGDGAPGNAGELRVAGVHGTLLRPTLARAEGGKGSVVLNQTRAVVDAPNNTLNEETEQNDWVKVETKYGTA